MLIFSETFEQLLTNNIPDNRKVFLIIDSNVHQATKEIKELILNNKIIIDEVIEIFTGEEHKTMLSVEKLIGKLMEKEADRNCFIIGIGGGITTDIVGFTASIFKRGVDFALIPTTLLAQTDAAIGGKNGVNFNGYKNIIGVIKQPQWTGISTELLRTLNIREFRAGIAEILKTFIIYDGSAYENAVKYFSELNRHYNNSIHSIIDKTTGKIYKEEELLTIIKLCSLYKEEVVARDEFEKGERRLLNLGHTFAHAIEKEFNYPDNNLPAINHGEAVAAGIIMASKIAGLEDFTQKLTADFEQCGLPTNLNDFITSHNLEHNYNTKFNQRRILAHIKNDKKANNGDIHFIVPYNLQDVRDITFKISNLEQFEDTLQ